MDIARRSELIRKKALSLGFSACGFASVEKLMTQEQGLKDYLENNYYGEMTYMANHFDKRIDPSLLVPGAKSAIVVLLNYFPQKVLSNETGPMLSKYAYGEDYHEVVKGKLAKLFDFIGAEIAPVQGRYFCDSAPVLERAWAVKAGLGWIGKNGLLINRKLGSFVFIGELFVDIELEYDRLHEKNYCGNCTRCLNSCPSSAFVAPYRLDARKCISYLTIELKGELPEDLKPALKNRIFGCDICQDVCPWNQRLTPHNVREFIPREELFEFSSSDWENITNESFNGLFSKSALKRAGYSKLKQNIANVMSVGNQSDTTELS
jgi:epoxyqueuosine reductase